MAWNFKQELGRKFIHLLSVSILLIYFIVGDIFNNETAMMILVLMLIIAIEFEYLRIELPFEIPILKKFWKYVRRDKEKGKLGGDVFFLLGAILVLAIFNIRIAMAAILMTTFGDMAAALVGKSIGKHPIKRFENKKWEGVIAEFMVNLVIGSAVLFWPGLIEVSSFGIFTIILVMSLVATFVETIIKQLDDNLLIPLFAGFNGQMLLLIFRLFN